MKLRWKITVALALLACAVLLFHSGGNPQEEAAKTRIELRQQGFKTDLSDFNLFAPDDARARAASLLNATNMRVNPEAVFMSTVGSNSAIVIWKQEQLRPDLAYANESILDAAYEGALSGPIRFHLDASKGDSMLLWHIAAIRNLTQMLGIRVMVDLREGKNDAAWTNLLAATRLVTAWDIEPCEVSHMFRCTSIEILFNITWQALQRESWTEERLATLQREWESLDLFKGLPQTAAFSRASVVELCRLEHQLPASLTPINAMFRSPLRAWTGLTDNLRRLRYRHTGMYEDEKALLLFYRNRELELRHAVQSKTWVEMRQLPGATNVTHFKSAYPSRVQSLLNLKQISFSFQGQGRGLLGRAAEAEARRRLVIAAIALERYRARHGSYPKTLQELAPELVDSPPLDFMDGQPLHYQLGNDEHFVLYSVGLDCVDNGGKMQDQEGFRPAVAQFGFGATQGTDLVWPRPASAKEERAAEQADTSILNAQPRRSKSGH